MVNRVGECCARVVLYDAVQLIRMHELPTTAARALNRADGRAKSFALRAARWRIRIWPAI
jgi:hypothetical protein